MRTSRKFGLRRIRIDELVNNRNRPEERKKSQMVVGLEELDLTDELLAHVRIELWILFVNQFEEKVAVADSVIPYFPNISVVPVYGRRSYGTPLYP